MGKEEPRDPLEELSGTALRAYLALLLHGPMGVRELARHLGLQSPSTARHHLERLERLGYAERTRDGRYAARPPARGLLRLFILLRGRLVPLTAASAAFTLAAAAAYTLLPGRDPAAVAALWLSALLQLLAARSHLQAARELEELAAGSDAGK